MISVIIPVYNTEKYLPQCLDSVIGQTYQDLEILLIDDGSSDCSGKICDDYARKDQRIKVIHQENQGVSAARNYGIQAASGAVISFIDSDDWLEPDMYERLQHNLETYQADIAICDVYESSDSGQRYRNIWGKVGEESVFSLEGEKKYTSGFSYTPVLWNKLIKRRLISERFSETCRYGEDTLFLISAVRKAEKIVIDKRPMYHYRFMRQGNVVSQSINSKMLDLLEAYTTVAEQLYLEQAKEAAVHLLYVAALQVIWKLPLKGLRKNIEYTAALKRMLQPYKADLYLLQKNPRTSRFRRGLVRMASDIPVSAVVIWNARQFLKG